MSTTKFTFKTFTEDYSNRFALATCKAISSDPPDYLKMLWVYGPKGHGKTHLLKATQNQFATIGESVFLCGESIFNSNDAKSLYKKIEKTEFLIIDDIDCLIGKEELQEEAASLFLRMVSNGQRVLISSTCYPKEISRLFHRVFGTVMVADLGFTRKEKYTEMLDMIKEDTGIQLCDDAKTLLVESDLMLPQFIRVLRRLENYYKKHNKKITYSKTKEYIDWIIRFYKS